MGHVIDTLDQLESIGNQMLDEDLHHNGPQHVLTDVLEAAQTGDTSAEKTLAEANQKEGAH